MDQFINLPGRLSRVDPENLTPAQQAVVNDVIESRGAKRGRVYSFRGAFYPVLQNPELLSVIQKLGEYCRYKSHLPPALSEFAILITCRVWGCRYAWAAHAPLAIKHGMPEAILEEVAKQQRPSNMTQEMAAVYEFAMALHRDKTVPDELFLRVKQVLGEPCVLDLTAICGYYTLLGMTILVDRTPMPEGWTAPF